MIDYVHGQRFKILLREDDLSLSWKAIETLCQQLRNRLGLSLDGGVPVNILLDFNGRVAGRLLSVSSENDEIEVDMAYQLEPDFWRAAFTFKVLEYSFNEAMILTVDEAELLDVFLVPIPNTVAATAIKQP